MTFPVEVVLKGHERAVTLSAVVQHGEPSTWTEAAARDTLVEILRAIDRVKNPDAPGERAVVLQGFSWIVEPAEGGVVLAIEIPMGAAVAGPFAIEQKALDALVTQVLRSERQMISPGTVH
jgi:hypothetical protein